MKLQHLLENFSQPKEFNFGKIKVTTKPSAEHSPGSIPNSLDLTTTVNSFKGLKFNHGYLGGMSKYTKGTGWITEFHTSVEDSNGNTILLKGEGVGQTVELSIQSALQDFIRSNHDVTT